MSIATAFAPASMGNVGVGFDVLGLAFREPGDTVTAEFCDAPGVEIAAISGDGGQLSYDPVKNTAAVAAAAVLDCVGDARGVRLTLHKGLPLASGLGSSAASAVAGAFAVNALLGNPLARRDLLPACLAGEAAVSGYHADNVAPSLLGGITLIVANDDIRMLPVPANLHFALVTPDIAVPTAAARAVLPPTVPLKTLVAQTAAVAELVDALYRADVQAVAVAMEKDIVIEPARQNLMPHMLEVRAAAHAAGAMSMVISGAGPTLCAVCDSLSVAETVAAAMGAIYAEHNIRCATRATTVCRDGARLVTGG